MSKAGQDYLLSEVRRSVEYCAREYDMTWAEAVGCLEMIAHYYTNLAFNLNSEDDDDGRDD